jgi:hypothetical protein
MINSDCFFFWGLAIVAGWQSNRKRSDKQGTADERTALTIETIGTNWIRARDGLWPKTLDRIWKIEAGLGLSIPGYQQSNNPI